MASCGVSTACLALHSNYLVYCYIEERRARDMLRTRLLTTMARAQRSGEHVSKQEMSFCVDGVDVATNMIEGHGPLLPHKISRLCPVFPAVMSLFMGIACFAFFVCVVLQVIQSMT